MPHEHRVVRPLTKYGKKKIILETFYKYKHLCSIVLLGSSASINHLLDHRQSANVHCPLEAFVVHSSTPAVLFVRKLHPDFNSIMIEVLLFYVHDVT